MGIPTEAGARPQGVPRARTRPTTRITTEAGRMPATFDIDVTAEDDALVARLTGELDLTASDAVVDALVPPVSAAASPRLVIDMAGVSFCDSSGLGALLDVRRAAAEADVHMVLRGVNRQVARLLDLADADGWLTRE
jgi:anti-sigma B factor antagonist